MIIYSKNIVFHMDMAILTSKRKENSRTFSCKTQVKINDEMEKHLRSQTFIKASKLKLDTIFM